MSEQLYRMLSETFLPKCKDGSRKLRYSIWVDDAVSVGLIPLDDFKRITVRGSAFERTGLLKIMGSVWNGWVRHIRKNYYMDCVKLMEGDIQMLQVIEYLETLNNWQANATEKLNVAYFNKHKIASRQPTYTEKDQKVWTEDGKVVQEAAKQIAANKRN